MNKLTWEQAVLWLRRQPDQQELVHECYFDDPLIEAAGRFADSEEWQTVAALLPGPPGRALDLGAGRGISSFALARGGWQVDALEPDASPIVGRGAIQSLAEQSGLPIRPVEGYAENIPGEDDRYDLVYGRQVLHHARDLRQMCAEAVRVLKAGGMFIATREHVISRREDLQAFLDSHPLQPLYGGENAFLLSEYIQAIRTAGLKLRRVLGPSESPINYFPEKNESIRIQLARPVFRVVGRRVGEALMALPLIGASLFKALSWMADRRNHIPGRLYSFVAGKAGR